MGVKIRGVRVTAAAIINGILGRNTGVVLTIDECLIDTDTDEATEVISSGPIINLDQLSYSHTSNDDDQDTGVLLIKKGDEDVLVINGQDWDLSDNTPWTFAKMQALWSELYSINTN